MGYNDDRHDHGSGGNGGTKLNPEVINAEESRTDPRTITIRVPSDFNTVAGAIGEIESIRTPPGVNYEIIIESGHTFQETVYIREEDLRHVTISSEDATVPIDAASLEDPFGNNVPRLFVGWGATVMPSIGALFAGGGAAVRGLLLTRGAGMRIGKGAGFDNMERGMDVSSGSWITGETDNTGVVCQNMSGRGVSAVGGSHVYLPGLDATGCDIGLRLAHGATASVQDSIMSGCRIGIRSLFHCDINARRADVSNATDQGINVSVASVDIVNGNASGAGLNDIELSGGSFVRAFGCTTTGGTPAVGDTNVSSFNSVSSSGILFA